SAVVHYDKTGDDNNTINYTSVTLGKGKDSTPVGLHNVADGKIGDESHDAINGSQINTISGDVAKFLGGDAAFKGGTFTGPTYKLSKLSENGAAEETSYDNVGSAFEGLDTNIKNVNQRIKEVSQGVAQDSLLWDNNVQAFVAKHGEKDSKTNSKITSLLDGTINENSTDAVTGKQLHTLGDKVAKTFGGGAGYEGGEWTDPNFKVKQIGSDGDVTDESYKTVADAFSSVGSSFKSIHDKISTMISDSLVKKNSDKNDITIGGEVEGSEINIANKSGVDRTLSGVKAATKDNEAVNKAQLDQSLEQLSNNLQSDDSAVVHYDKDDRNGAINYTSVTLGKGQGSSPVGLHNVADGKIAKDSRDAITGGQVNKIGEDVAKFLGGNAKFSDGAFTEPTYKLSKVSTEGNVEEAEFKNVGSAFVSLDENIKNVNERIKDVSESVAQDSLNWNEGKKAFVATHGEDKANSKITSLLDGAIDDSSTDAVTGKQLHALGDKVAKSLGGDAGYAEGKWTAPKFTVKTVNENGSAVEEHEYDTVVAAFAGVGASFENLQKEITQSNTEVAENIKQNALLWSEKDHAFVATHGKDGEKVNSKITSLQAGAISESSTDAVNGSQLYSMGSDVAKYLGGGAGYAEGKWTAPSFKVKSVNEDGKTEDKEYSDVASAFAEVGTSFTNIKNEINKEITNVVSDSLVKFDEKTNLIKIGGEKEGASINIADKDSKDRILSGVKKAENDNEAVNKGQLDESLKDLSNSLQSDDSAVVHYDKKDDDTSSINYTSVTFGKGKDSAPVSLHNVADGTLSEGSHDVVNGGQVSKIGEDLAKFLGGEASFKDGAFTGPTYKLSKVSKDGQLEDKSFENVGAAFTGLDENIKNVNQRIKDVSESVAQDSLNWNEKEGAFVAQHGEEGNKTNSKITSLQAGAISDSSTDAVNGSQLYSLNTTLAQYLGGGSGYVEGKWTAPSFKVKTINEDGSAVEEQSYESVAEAFAGVGTSFTNIHNEVKNEINKVVGDSLVKQDEETKVIKIGGEKTGNEITIANSDGAARSLSGVKAASLSATSTEAVNGSQLYSLNTTLAKYLGGGAEYKDGEWKAPEFKVTTYDDGGVSHEESYESVAAAFAGVSSSFMKLHNEVSNNLEQNALLWSDEDQAFVALHGKGGDRSKSKLKSLLDGDISEGSTEAITGNQLYSLNTTLAKYFGGEAGYKDGAWTAPSFKVLQFNADGSSSSKQSYPDVASAFDGVSESMTSINDRVQEVEKNVASNGLNWNEETGSYDARHKGEASKITNVAAGKIEKGSQEVVNGGQLWITNEKIKDVENRVDTIDQQVQDITIAVTDGAVNYDKDADGKKTNSITLKGGNESEPVLIDNLADGRIEKGSKEAINGGQLHDYTDQQMKIVLDDAKKYTDDQVGSIVKNGINEAKSYTDIKFETLSYVVEDVRKEARQAAAIGLAVSNLRYYDIPGSLSVSFGSGTWRSQSAIAFGAGYTSEDGNIRSNISVTSAGGHWGVGAGVTLRLR
uniref:Vomp family autotransporter n=1 Tax=Bartonella vinsonii TaxID=33047 RepID=UPI001ABA5610